MRKGYYSFYASVPATERRPVAAETMARAVEPLPSYITIYARAAAEIGCPRKPAEVGGSFGRNDQLEQDAAGCRPDVRYTDG